VKQRTEDFIESNTISGKTFLVRCVFRDKRTAPAFHISQKPEA